MKFQIITLIIFSTIFTGCATGSKVEEYLVHRETDVSLNCDELKEELSYVNDKIKVDKQNRKQQNRSNMVTGAVIPVISVLLGGGIQSSVSFYSDKDSEKYLRRKDYLLNLCTERNCSIDKEEPFEQEEEKEVS